MVKNTPEALQKIVENLLLDLYKNHNCWGWDCSDCPLYLREPVCDCWGNMTRCGWLLLATGASKIYEEITIHHLNGF